ncbi:hypothetical protein DY000_02031390 [Brassica cretica]|uniref:Secreted protein n=1 Tax=Brassica cretica TaxID=69181 RepID=A0ABQ7DHU5_BRACR|nr:hypothetical protein DY000_02031390 [Brassica cretica]
MPMKWVYVEVLVVLAVDCAEAFVQIPPRRGVNNVQRNEYEDKGVYYIHGACDKNDHEAWISHLSHHRDGAGRRSRLSFITHL